MAPSKEGIIWTGFQGDEHSLSQAIMAVRPSDYKAKSKIFLFGYHAINSHSYVQMNLRRT